MDGNIEKTAKETIDALLVSACRLQTEGEALSAPDGAEAMRFTQAALNAANALVLLKNNGLAN